MFKWAKRIFYLMVIFTGLYFFGDFEVNGVNVRGYLQKKMTRENIEIVKEKLGAVYRLILQGKALLEKQTPVATATANGQAVTKPEAKEKKPSLLDDPNLKKAEQVYLEHISGKDQKKLEELLKKQLESTGQK